MGDHIVAKNQNDSDEPDLLRRTVENDLGDRYRIESVLGFGRAARVYLAREAASGRLVALKVVPLPQRRSITASDLLHRFEREAAKASALRYSHLVPIRAFGTAATYLWYDMDYVEAPSLAQVLSTAGALDLDPCLAIIDQMASALDFIHRRGIAHGNLRTTHIFVDSERWARLSDFNVSKAVEDLSPIGSHDEPLRVLQYVAPEQFDTRVSSAGADQYALAVVAYECLAGQPPFRADSVATLEQLHQIATPTPLTRIRPDVPQHVDYAIRRALGKTVHTRFANVTDFASMLHGGSWAPERTQIIAPTDVPLRAPRVIMGDPTPYRIPWLGRPLSALRENAYHLLYKARTAMRRSGRPTTVVRPPAIEVGTPEAPAAHAPTQPIQPPAPPPPAPAAAPTTVEPPLMPVPQQAEESPIPERPEIERFEVAPHIEITSAPPDEGIEDETGTPPLKEAAARLEEAAAALAALRETTAPPAAEETPQEQEEKAEEFEPAAVEEPVAVEEPEVGEVEAVEVAEDELIVPEVTTSQPPGDAERVATPVEPSMPAEPPTPARPTFEPAAAMTAEREIADVGKPRTTLQVGPTADALSDRGDVAVIPAWRASLGRLFAAARRSAAGLSEAIAKIDLAPAVAALGASWRAVVRLLAWIWAALVSLARIVASASARLAAAVGAGLRRGWAFARPALQKAFGATGQALVRWSKATGQALLRGSIAAGRALARWSKATGQALLRGSIAAGRALARWSVATGQALLRLWLAAGSALRRWTAAAGRTLLRDSKVVGPALSRWSRATREVVGRGWRTTLPVRNAILTGFARLKTALTAVGDRLGGAQRVSARLAATTGEQIRKYGSAVAYWFGGIRGKIWLFRLRARMQARQTEKSLPAWLASSAVKSPWIYVIGVGAAAIVLWAGTSLLQSGPSEQRGTTTGSPETVVATPPTGADAAGAGEDPGVTEGPEEPAEVQTQPQAPSDDEPPQLAQQPAAQETPTPVTTTPDRDQPVTAAPTVQPQEDVSAPAAPAEPARLFINSRPWGRVFIDGELIGNTPQLNLQVPPGRHVIRVEQSGHEPFEREVQLAAGEVVRITDIVLEEEG